MSESRVLLAAFEPFGGESVNASWEAVQRLASSDGGVEVLCLPCTYGGSGPALLDGIARVRPDVLLLVGQAAGRAEICVERIAINLDDASLPDNSGEVRHDRAIADGGPAAFLTTLPAARLVAGLRQAGIPARVSLSAGTYVCNHAFYEAMRLAARRRLRAVGLIHVPITPGQAAHHAGSPSMATETVARALQLIVATSRTNPPAGGAAV